MEVCIFSEEGRGEGVCKRSVCLHMRTQLRGGTVFMFGSMCNNQSKGGSLQVVLNVPLLW